MQKVKGTPGKRKKSTLSQRFHRGEDLEKKLLKISLILTFSELEQKQMKTNKSGGKLVI